MKFTVPVPVSVSSSTDATGVRAVGHVSGADKLENQSHYLHCATVAQTDIIIITRVPHTHTQSSSLLGATHCDNVATGDRAQTKLSPGNQRTCYCSTLR